MEKLRPGDPEQLGPYKIIARLGSGGMGVVFLGSQGSRRVAVKVVRSSFLDNPSLRTRFEREIDTLKKLKSKHVAAYLDSDVDGELAWHAVEFVNGPTLREQIEHDGPMSPDEWWAFYENLKTALTDLHAFGITHRDLKPSNIILSETGIKLIDFGIAQDSEATSITTTGTVTGSPAWLSPEHLEGTELGPASDLFSAGSILVYAAKGTSPWGNETTMTVPVAFQRILSLDLRLDGLNPEFEPAVRALLVSDAASRSFIKGGPISTTGVSRREPSENTKKENVATQPASPPRGPSVPARPSFTRRPEQAPQPSKSGINGPQTKRRQPALGFIGAGLLLAAGLALALYVQSSFPGNPVDAIREETVIADPIENEGDPAAITTVDVDTYVSQIEEVEVFWVYYAQGIIFNVELPRDVVIADRPELIAVQWDAGAISPTLECQSNRMDNPVDSYRFRLLCLRDGGRGTGAIQVSISATNTVQRAVIPIEALARLPGDARTFSTYGASGDSEASGDGGPLRDSEVELVVGGNGFGAFVDRSTFSVKVPYRPSNPVEDVSVLVSDSDGLPVTYFEDDQGGECLYGFEMDRQPSASRTERFFLKDCGTSGGVTSGTATLEVTYEDGSSSTHLKRFEKQRFECC